MLPYKNSRTRAILPHVLYMAIYIVERTEFLMEFMFFRYHKRKGNIHLLDVSNKQCYLTFSSVILSCVCVSLGNFVPLNEIVS